jgi:type I restriction enzyme S subunit
VYGISDALQKTGEYGVLRMGDVGYGDVSTANLARVDQVDQSLLVTKGDLLFNRTNSYEQVAKIGLLRDKPSEKITFASYLVRYHPVANGEYLAYLLNIPTFLEFVRAHSLRAIGQVNLSPTRYAQFKICLPPPEEQAAIVDFLHFRTKAMVDGVKKLEEAIQYLIELRSALIMRAVTGKMDVRSFQQREAAE